MRARRLYIVIALALTRRAESLSGFILNVGPSAAEYQRHVRMPGSAAIPLAELSFAFVDALIIVIFMFADVAGLRGLAGMGLGGFREMLTLTGSDYIPLMHVGIVADINIATGQFKMLGMHGYCMC